MSACPGGYRARLTAWGAVNRDIGRCLAARARLTAWGAVNRDIGRCLVARARLTAWGAVNRDVGRSLVARAGVDGASEPPVREWRGGGKRHVQPCEKCAGNCVNGESLSRARPAGPRVPSTPDVVASTFSCLSAKRKFDSLLRTRSQRQEPTSSGRAGTPSEGVSPRSFASKFCRLSAVRRRKNQSRARERDAHDQPADSQGSASG